MEPTNDATNLPVPPAPEAIIPGAESPSSALLTVSVKTPKQTVPQVTVGPAKAPLTLKGKKTYIISVLSVAFGVAELLHGHTYGQVLPYLLAGAFGGSLRAAIASVEERVLSVLPSPVEELVKPLVDEELAKVEG